MSFLTGYVLGMTLNKSPNRSYHERDFEKEQLKIKCQELKNQIADLSKTIERLQEQLNEANEVIKGYAECYKKYPDGTMFAFEVRKHPAHLYLKKWGV